MTEVKSLSEIANHPDSQKNDNNNTQNNTNTNTSGCVYDKWGRTPDKSYICAIGIKSATADKQSGVTKSVFENKCAHCGQPALMWGWKWDNDSEKVQKFNGTDGTAEGHIYCVQSEGGCDADYSIEGNEHIDGSTHNLTVVSGPTPSSEEEAEQLSNGSLACDGSYVSNDSSNIGGSATLIPDKTFYGLIKQILGAIDGLFIISNNMAYLLSFKDFYEYRNLYNQYIPVIDKKSVLQDSLIKNWTTNGFYNAVEVEYADGIIKYQNDALVQQYGENTFYYSFPSDDEETAKAKAYALLGAHTRDYSTEIQLSIFYDEKITAGSWVKLHKSLSQLSNEIQNESLQKNDNTISTKHKGINITNITEKTIVQDNITRTVQTITDKEGNNFDIEIDKSEYELFFVNNFTCRWDKNNALIMDLILKYGPDTPEDPINATIGMGQTVSSSGNSDGQYGNDCFTIDDICVANNEKIYGHYSGGASVEAVKSLVNGKHSPESSDYQPRANQNSNYNKKYGSLTAPEVYSNFRSEYRYSLYADNCNCWKCATDFYDNAGKTANCGDSTCLLKVFYDCIGVPSCGVHIDGHYFNAIQINGTWEIIDGVRADNQTCNFPDGTGYCFGNPYPCNSYRGNNNE